jgi:hypothetical protein
MAKAAWTPSTAKTFGYITDATKWVPADDKEYPKTFPTMAISRLKGIKTLVQVCVRGKVTQIQSTVLKCKEDQKWNTKVKKEPSAEGVTKDKDFAKALLVDGSVCVRFECWEEFSGLLKGVADDCAIRIDRALWQKDERLGGFILKACAVTTVTILAGSEATSVVQTASATPEALSIAFTGSGRGAEGKGHIVTLSSIQSMLDEHAARKGMDAEIWEVPWAHFGQVTNTKHDAAELSYKGCKECFMKDCKKHEPVILEDCYSLFLSAEDAVATVQVKVFTKVARQIFAAITGEETFTDEEVTSQIGSKAFTLRVRVGFEEAWQTRSERNFLEVVGVLPLPLTFQYPKQIHHRANAFSNGVPDVHLESVSVNALGHLLVGDERYTAVRFLAELTSKATMETAEDNAGVRVKYDCKVRKGANEWCNVTLVWTAALGPEIQPVMSLKIKNFIYVAAHPADSDTIWNVDKFVVADQKDAENVAAAFIARVLMAEQLRTKPSAADETMTPLKRKASLLDASAVCEIIGVYE